MDSKIYGFVGVESFDIVHLLGNVLSSLGFTLTVVDYSPLGDVIFTVPGYDGSQVSYSYNNLEIYRSVPLEEVRPSEFMLLYFGMNVKHPYVAKCDEVWLFSDSQLQKINAICNVNLTGKQPRFVVFRDRQLTRATKSLILDELSELNVQNSNFIELDDDTSTLDLQFRVQYDSKILFKNVSSNICDLIVNLLEADFEVKDIKRGMKGVLGKK